MKEEVLLLMIMGLKSQIEEQSKTKEFYIESITKILKTMIDSKKISIEDYEKSIDILNKLEF